jgi:uncharacterized protein YbjT (DUF2867 family)
MNSSNPRPILVTGATGYIASRLIPRLLEKGYAVRCLARDPARLAGRPWAGQVEIFQGDVTCPETLSPALSGAAAAYYLIHSMASGSHYYERDMEAAANFACAARESRVEHIIYLGGLADPEAEIAPHMRSRILTGEYLRTCGMPVTEFRAGVIVGPGSISFEMIRFLCEHLPVLVGPRWLENHSQPIAAQNVLDYLLAALENRDVRGGVYEIGGPDVLTYAGTMQVYARLRGLRRPVFFLPGLPVQLMAFIVDKLTPVPQAIAQPLIEGLMSDSQVRDDSARRLFPDVELLGYEQAVCAALGQLTPAHVEPVWNDSPGAVRQVKHEGFFIDHRSLPVQASPQEIFRVLAGLGGSRGWPFANGLWQARGWLDSLLGGPGLRGRSHPDRLHPGDVLDYYRVETAEDGRLLRLHSELKAPGEGWMEWLLRPAEGGCQVSQTAYFAPRGLAGCLYWYLLKPVHTRVFRGLIEAVARRAEAGPGG